MSFRFFVSFLCAALLAGFAPDEASAQSFDDYQRRQADIQALAVIFGELHHIRRNCEPRYEADTWRDRMKRMMELEEPEDETRKALIAAFNSGYRKAQARYRVCDRRARDYAAARAVEGDAIVRRLAEPLYEAIERDEKEALKIAAPQEQ